MNDMHPDALFTDSEVLRELINMRTNFHASILRLGGAKEYADALCSEADAVISKAQGGSA